MKCPYLKKVIHKPQVYDGYEILNYQEDISEMCDCLQKECPFYYITEEHKPSYNKLKEHCQRAESEVVKHDKI